MITTPCARIMAVTHSWCRYDAIIDLTRKLNSKYKHPKQTQEATKKILKSLFPGWLPGAFSVSVIAKEHNKMQPDSLCLRRKQCSEDAMIKGMSVCHKLYFHQALAFFKTLLVSVSMQTVHTFSTRTCPFGCMDVVTCMNIVACTDIVTCTADMTCTDAGNVLKACASVGVPAECLGHCPDMPMADGTVQDQ